MINDTIEKPAKVAINGVDVPTVVATLGVVEGQRDLAKFTFRADGKWISGTHSRAEFTTFHGAGGPQAHEVTHAVEGDHPAILCGSDKAPLPVELLLAALSACIVGGIGNIASIRQVRLHSVETTVEGAMDAQGILGMNPEVRNGFSAIRASFRIEGDASPEVLKAIVEQSLARSAVFDMLTNGVPVAVAIDA
jgi:uncharacterized OsmC-like protein